MLPKHFYKICCNEIFRSNFDRKGRGVRQFRSGYRFNPRACAKLGGVGFCLFFFEVQTVRVGLNMSTATMPIEMMENYGGNRTSTINTRTISIVCESRLRLFLSVSYIIQVQVQILALSYRGPGLL